jgi:hypothetical protein
MVMSTFDFNNSCYTSPDGQTDCVPAMMFFNTNVDTTTGKITISDLTYSDYIADLNQDGTSENIGFIIPDGLDYVDVPNTFYFAQSGISHSYEVEWSGPYLALDMLYDININNAVNARVEFGLPSYTATGDQPYRYDWQHPKSVEDKGGFGSAFHFGAGANWMTKITDSISLSIGITYDYYTVSDADAKTFLNSEFYEKEYNWYLDRWLAAGQTEADMLNPDPDSGEPAAIDIKKMEQDCPGWVCTADGEIESFYKSLGIRVGINAKF